MGLRCNNYMLINYGVNNKNLEGDKGFIDQVTIMYIEQFKRIDNNRWQCYYYDKDKYLDAYKTISTEELVGIISYYKTKKTRITYKFCTWDKFYNSEEQKGGEIL